MTTTSFAIAGMTCNGCRAKVETALRKLVPDASVTLDPPRALFHAPQPVPLASVQAALAGAGNYTAANESGTPAVATFDANWLATYYPLLLIAGYIGVVSLAGGGAAFGMVWMNNFMAGFFLVFSFFKLLDIRGFASSYAGYDLLAQRVPGYGLVYPFIELALGLACLFRFMPFATNVAVIAVMGFSSLGVLKALSEKQKIRCACLGTVLNLPMSTVTLVEDVLMIGMAGAMLALG